MAKTNDKPKTKASAAKTTPSKELPTSSKAKKRPRKPAVNSSSDDAIPSENPPSEHSSEAVLPRPPKKRQAKQKSTLQEPLPRQPSTLALPPPTQVVQTEPIPYPYDQTLTFINRKHSDNLALITKMDKEPEITLYPDMDALRHLKIGDEVHSRLTQCGLQILFDDDPGMYPKLVREFISSFEAVRNVGKEITHWKFVLGGSLKRLTKDVVCEMLGFPMNGENKIKYADVDRYLFWRQISARDEWFVSGYSATTIKNKVWKVIHRLIAMGINVRKDGGRMVTNHDLDIMLAINEGKVLDWFSILAKRFEEYVKETSQVLALGGGSFVTHLAIKCNFTFSDNNCPPPERKALTLEALRGMTMLKPDLKNWVHSTKPHKKPLRRTARAKKNKFNLKRRGKTNGVHNPFSDSKSYSTSSSAPTTPPNEPSFQSHPPPKKISHQAPNAHQDVPFSHTILERLTRLEQGQRQILVDQSRILASQGMLIAGWSRLGYQQDQMAESISDFWYQACRAQQWAQDSWCAFFQHHQFSAYTDPPSPQFVGPSRFYRDFPQADELCLMPRGHLAQTMTMTPPTGFDHQAGPSRTEIDLSEFQEDEQEADAMDTEADRNNVDGEAATQNGTATAEPPAQNEGAETTSRQGKKLVITDEYFQRVTQALIMRLRQHEETVARDGSGLAGMLQRDLIQWYVGQQKEKNNYNSMEEAAAEVSKLKAIIESLIRREGHLVLVYDGSEAAVEDGHQTKTSRNDRILAVAPNYALD